MGMIGARKGEVSVELKDSPAVEGEGIPRGCPWQRETPIEMVEGAETVYELFELGFKRNPNGACHGYRPVGSNGEAGPFKWVSYAETRKNVLALGAAMKSELGMSKGDTVGIFGKNCPSWATTQLAASAQGMILVPLYDTLGANAVEYVINHAECKAVFVSLDNAEPLLALKAAGKLPTVNSVVVFDREGIESAKVDAFGPVKAGEVKSVASMVAKGKEAGGGDSANTGKLDDLFIIMYTSGTTGNPKGVKLLNRAIVSATATAHKYFLHYAIPFCKEDSILSFLPLAHIFEQHTEADFYAAGARVGYYQGDVRKLLDDLEALKPTMFVGVPRVYMRFQQKIEEASESLSGLKRKLFNWAYNSALDAEQKLHGRNFLLDHLVINKIRNKIVPNVRLMITGSAPLSGKTNDFLKVCLNAPLVQGYGLTESTGGFVCSPPYNSVSGHCGGPLPGCFVKLRDVPDMNYKSSDKPFPRGEILLKGDLVTVGYHKNDEETQKTLQDGWFATGDIGQWLADGSLQIIDRKKNMFKLSQGEYVSPEVLENEYVKCKLISQIWVYGNSFEAFLVAVVVPDPITCSKWAAEKGNATKDLAAITGMSGFKEAVMAELNDARSANNFKGFEAIKNIVFETNVNELGQGFTVENDLLTPTFKYKRPQLTTKYKAQLDGMYGK
eukprot:CAMPEP_0198336050 /NCGR_PEP_ID=MMETSP1450-20131203/20728_1 /TAXON_ID=753684 ORGANISM="Madagascaria erythrocladiodes, Strain CCMP3234" /NCGR_SAMPLE_ID=MMETSP1450 /ASSEMBLY_ACC=CAM_ASM_001115 /LENGTH=669 /DNA_ID=CAMNT_0044040755 /DNA_START=77 /DNA_END=2086 /DNA_ORIENTATION=-